jgi:hypothetical protein
MTHATFEVESLVGKRISALDGAKDAQLTGIEDGDNGLDVQLAVLIEPGYFGVDLGA